MFFPVSFPTGEQLKRRAWEPLPTWRTTLQEMPPKVGEPSVLGPGAAAHVCSWLLVAWEFCSEGKCSALHSSCAVLPAPGRGGPYTPGMFQHTHFRELQLLTPQISLSDGQSHDACLSSCKTRAFSWLEKLMDRGGMCCGQRNCSD